MTAIPILLYHSVGEAPSPATRPWYVSTADFAEQMRLIGQFGFSCLTVSELVDAIDGDTLPPKPLVITFDDGGVDFADNALPILDRYLLPSTMYVPSAHVGRFFPWSPREPQVGREIMSWEVLRSLDPKLVELGAHSATHPQLDVVRPAQQRSEIADSKAQLEDGLGRSVRSFAYPHGYHSAPVRSRVRDAGFDSACACGKRWSHVADDRFALSRLTVFGDVDIASFEAMLSTPPEHAAGPRHLQRWGWRSVRRGRRLVGAL